MKKQRSPSYPGISLREAMERAKAFLKAEGKHEALVTTALTHWKYSAKSSAGLITIAALKAYGLMADKGTGAERKVFLTPFGYKLAMDERPVSPEREEGLREAALKPKIMAELWKKYGSDLPSEATLSYYLRAEREFTEAAAKDVIRIYVDNMKFARLDAPGASASGDEALNDDDISADPTGNLDGDAGVGGAPPPATGTPTLGRPPVPVLGVTHGEEIGNYRVSKNTTIRLLSNGPYSRKSIESLVKQLQLAIDLGNFDDLQEGDE